MAPQVTHIDIARPPDEVYGYVTDPRRFAQWQGDVAGVTIEGGGPPTLGTRFTTTRRIGGVDRVMTQEITAVEPGRRWTARGVDGPIRPHATVTVEPLDGGTRSRVTFELDFEGHGLGDMLVPFVRRMAAKGAPKSYENLRRILEGG